MPGTTREATAQFITDALQAGGTIGTGTRVAGFVHEPFAPGIALSGQLARLHLAYEGPPGPATAILKMPPVEPENRALGHGFGFYVREARFYADLAPRLPVRVPRCHGSRIEKAAGASALLLEDLGTWTPGCQIAGATAEQAFAAVREMAALHAYGWAAPDGTLPRWLHRFDDPLHLMMGQLYRDTWPAFAVTYGKVVGPTALAVGERIGPVFEQIQRVATLEAPLTLCHGDWRMDNLLFSPAGEVAVVDWQVVHLGPGVEDLAMFLTQSLPVRTRRRYERALVAAWHDRLADLVPGGPGSYTAEIAWEHYRRMALFTTLYPVAVSVAMNLQNERDNRLLEAMMTRSFAAVVDLDAAGLVPA